MIDHIAALFDLGLPSWIAGAAIAVTAGHGAWRMHGDRTLPCFKRGVKRIVLATAIAFVALSGMVGGVLVLARIAIGYSIASGLWRILGARTLRTFAHRLVLVGQRVMATVLVTTIALAVATGGLHFHAAPMFVALAILVIWTLKTNEASVDRRDRLTAVTRRYA